MIMQQQLLWGGLLPALIAAFFLFLALQTSNKERIPPKTGAWGAPIAFGLAYVCAHIATVGVPPWVPIDRLGWLFYLAPIATCVGLVEGFLYQRTKIVFLMRLALAGTTFWLTLGFMVEHHWSAGVAALWMGGLSLGATLIIGELERAAEEFPGASGPLVTFVLAAGAAAVLVLTANAKVGLLMGGLAAASAAAVGIAWWRPALRISRGGCTVFGVLFSALLAFGYMTSADVPELSAFWRHPPTMATLLVAAAPLMLWVGRLGFVRRMPAAAGVAVRAGLIAVVALGAIGVLKGLPQNALKTNQFDDIDYQITDESEEPAPQKDDSAPIEGIDPELSDDFGGIEYEVSPE